MSESWARWAMFEEAVTVSAAELWLRVRLRGADTADEILFAIDMERAMSLLEPELRSILLLAAYGYTQAQIASNIGRSLRTVVRRMGEHGLRTLPDGVGKGRKGKRAA